MGARAHQSSPIAIRIRTISFPASAYSQEGDPAPRIADRARPGLYRNRMMERYQKRTDGCDCASMRLTLEIGRCHKGSEVWGRSRVHRTLTVLLEGLSNVGVLPQEGGKGKPKRDTVQTCRCDAVRARAINLYCNSIILSDVAGAAAVRDSMYVVRWYMDTVQYRPLLLYGQSRTLAPESPPPPHPHNACYACYACYASRNTCPQEKCQAASSSR